jgi:hypothetical protein
VIRRRAAAAAEHVDEPRVREVLQQARRVLRQLVVLAEGVRQAGVRVAGDVALGDARQLGEVGTHLVGAERAVESDAERPGVADRGVERVQGLPRQRAAATVGDGDGDHQRQRSLALKAALLEHLEDGGDRRLGVQRVEDRLEQQQVAAAVDQPAHLVAIGVAHLIEGHGAERRVVHVGRDGQRAVGRTQRAGHEARPVGGPRRPFVRGGARQPRALEVELVGERLEPVVGLRDGGGAERVGLDDVGAGLEVLAMNRADDVRPREHEHVAVALQLARVRAQPRAVEVGLGEAAALDHRPHRAVEEEDPRGEETLKGGGGGHEA